MQSSVQTQTESTLKGIQTFVSIYKLQEKFDLIYALDLN